MYKVANEKYIHSTQLWEDRRTAPVDFYARPLPQRVDLILQAVCERRLPRLTGYKTPLEDSEAAAAVAAAAGALDPGEK